jgi:hypothetical protein
MWNLCNGPLFCVYAIMVIDVDVDAGAGAGAAEVSVIGADERMRITTG